MASVNCELRKIYSQRGRVLLLKDRFKYSKYGGLQSGETGWKCVEKSCRAKLYTKGDDCELSRETGEHLHSPLDENVIMRQAISNRLKRKSTECLSAKPSKLVDLELKTNENALTKLTLNDIKLIKDNMYHARAKKKQSLPPKNKTRRQLVKIDDLSVNSTREQTLSENDNLTLARSSPDICKTKETKDNIYQEQENEEWPEWICHIQPHFLATGLI